MRLEDFDYQLPKELIAQYPLPKRDNCRLMVIRRGEWVFEHRVFVDILEYLGRGDCLVLNNTKVLACRLKGKRKTGGKVEVLLLERLGSNRYRILFKPKRVKIDEEVIFGAGRLKGRLIDKDQMVFITSDPKDIYSLGDMPLPSYIKRQPEQKDREFYQTVYARYQGAVAAPTAGLHFTAELLEKIRRKGVKIAYVTLHTGYATFAPVRCQDITQHRMEEERFSIPASTIEVIKRTKKQKGRVFAVGTTSCRALETYALGKRQGKSSLFIYPGFKFRLVDCLLTNFHLPRTTLLMLVYAFGGAELIRRAYQEAITKKYRFFSYGDAMLIL